MANPIAGDILIKEINENLKRAYQDEEGFWK